MYFCDPRSPWQHGTHENTNRLLRQYFPKDTDLSQYTQQHLDEISLKLNTQPRKTLGFIHQEKNLIIVLHSPVERAVHFILIIVAGFEIN